MKSDMLYTFVCATILVVFLLAIAGRGACAGSGAYADAEQAVEDFGFTEVKALDKSVWFVGLRGCDGGDAVLVRVRGTNALGKTVTVNVCMGWLFNGATVRGRR